MSEQLLSADPSAGLLSTDPNAGAAWTPPAVPRDARGLPTASSNLAEGEPSRLLEMLGPLAHPETFIDFARLLTLPVDTVKKALAGALTAAAARQPAATALSATGRGVERAGTALEGASGNIGLADAVLNKDPVRGMAIAIAPKVIKFAGRGLQRAGAALADAPAGPAASVAAEAAPVTAPAVTNALPNQKLLNELALAARRVKVTLTPEMEQAAIEAVGNGASPAEAVATVAPARAAAPAATAAKFRLVGQEERDYRELIKAGKTRQEAFDLIEAQRKFGQRFDLPSGEQVRQAVRDRNQTGRWPTTPGSPKD